MSGPLSGLRVLDLGTRIAAPFCAGLLGEQGAEVVKIEQPGTGEPDGPSSLRPGLDRVGIGYGGLLNLTGYPDRPPARVGVAISDHLTDPRVTRLSDRAQHNDDINRIVAEWTSTLPATEIEERCIATDGIKQLRDQGGV